MRIQNNMSAINTHRQLGINQLNQARSTEKLSSGFRINRAADDAAGLSISEKMRSQIRGLNRASMNALDGISMVQAAEGALQESHRILQRMRELAVQGANDVNAAEDRAAILDEINQLGRELDRIADTTNFNGKFILSGEFAAFGDNSVIDAELMRLPNPSLRFGEGGEIGTFTAEMSLGTIFIQAGANTLPHDAIGINFQNVNASALLNSSQEGTEAGNSFWLMMGEEGPQPNWLGALNSPTVVAEFGEINPEYLPVQWGEGGLSGTDAGKPLIYGETDGGPQHFGWTIAAFQSFINVIDGLNPNGSMITDYVTTPRTGLALISQMRSELGAVQNRLEHTISNLDTVAENVQAAESRLRDTDMASEMMEFTRNNILNQAATAMLAQANQLPQTVLQLLQ